MICSKTVLVALTGITLANTAGAETISFDDLLDEFTAGFHTTPGAFGSFYADLGMTISARDSLWLGNGIEAGDAGNFDIDGTNGPGFIALWEPPSSQGWVTFAFDDAVNITMDFITTQRSSSADTEFFVIGTRNGDEVFNDFETLPHPAGDPDGEATNFSFNNIDTLTIQLGINSDRVLAFDNLVFNAVPTPSSLALLGLGGLVGTRRRR